MIPAPLPPKAVARSPPHSKASRNLSPVVRLATGPAAGMNGAAPAFTPPLAHGIFRARFPAPPRAQVAQLVEQRTENPRVGGSIPSLGTILSPRRNPTMRRVTFTLSDDLDAKLRREAAPERARSERSREKRSRCLWAVSQDAD